MAAESRFLVKALKSLPANCAVSRELGYELTTSLKENNKVVHGVCPYCNTLLVPGSTSSVRTISRRRIKKTSKRYRIILNNSKKNHFLKVHCKICRHTHLIPCGLNEEKPKAAVQTTPTTSLAVGKPFFTPKRRRSSAGLKSLLKQSTPVTPPTPSLLDFLIG